MPATRKRADHDSIRRVQFVDHRPRNVAQPTGYPMPLHGAAN